MATDLQTETFTPEERRVLEPYFTDLDGPVFALTNLPEVVKGALFARYSRSPKSLRRLFLDEFANSAATGWSGAPFGTDRADALYDRVFLEYGDDSVAQLGGAHLACEGVSNLLTKVLERSRLMAYLEQSTRYIPYTDKVGGHWRHIVPDEIQDDTLRQRYTSALDRAFSVYAAWLGPVQEYFKRRYPHDGREPESAYLRSIRAKALDTLRGLLPAATKSNVGIYGNGQTYEALLLRLMAHPLAEARWYGEQMLRELRKVIPAFMKRVDLPDRGGAWSRYLAETRSAVQDVAKRIIDSPGIGVTTGSAPDGVTLSEYDPEGEIKVVAAALYTATSLSDTQLLARTRQMSPEERREVLVAYVGQRANRRHRPGRAFERTRYRFDIVSDYGAFRDLQRHRMLTIDWQPLSAELGFVVPADLEEVPPDANLGSAAGAFRAVMHECAAVYTALRGVGLLEVASYALPMAYRIRYCMDMNAREAMHVLELRTSPQAHPAYRRICQHMHRLIRDEAGHAGIAEAMRYVQYNDPGLERLQAEATAEKKRQEQAQTLGEQQAVRTAVSESALAQPQEGGETAPAEEELRFAFEWLSYKKAEDTVEKLGREKIPTRRVVLDLGECTGVDPSAGALLANALRRHAHVLSAVLPRIPRAGAKPAPDPAQPMLPNLFESEVATGATEVSSDMRSHVRNDKKDAGWFRIVLRSGLGYAITRYAQEIHAPDGADLTNEYREYFDLQAESVGPNLAFVPNLDTKAPVGVREDNFDSFYAGSFAKWIDTSRPRDVLLDLPARRAIARLCFEAATNVFKHARPKTASGGEEAILSYVALRFFKNISQALAFLGPWSDYMQRLASADKDASLGRFLEITVSDDGTGIASHYGRNELIYWSPFGAERDLFAAALQPGATSGNVHGRGYGFLEMREASRKLRALCAIRSGRVIAFYDGLRGGDGGVDAPLVSGVEAPQAGGLDLVNGFSLWQEPLANVPGTLVQFLVPLSDRQQMPLFGLGA